MSRPTDNSASAVTTLADFGNLKLIGKGSFGRVYRAKRNSDGIDYALKEVEIRHMNQKQREDAVNEVRVLASISHPKVIRYYEAFVDNERLYIVTEFGRYGDLYAKIKRQIARGKPFDEETIWSIFIQITQGLQAVHSRDIIHRDIKTPNIFLCSSSEVKIGDLGVAKVMKAGLAQTQIGTPYYMSPEIWKGRPYHKKSDIWSLGCLLYELATLQRPFEAKDERSLAQKVFRGVYDPVGQSRSPELQDLIKQCLSQDPNRRPCTDEILKMPFVAARIREGLHVAAEEHLNRGKALISTIRVPRDLRLLSHKLPEPKYSPLRAKSCFALHERNLDHPQQQITAASYQSPVKAFRGAPMKENMAGGFLPVLVENPREQGGNNGYKSSPARILPQVSRQDWPQNQRRSSDVVIVSPSRQQQQPKPYPPAVRRSADPPYGVAPRPTVISNMPPPAPRRRYNFDR